MNGAIVAAVAAVGIGWLLMRRRGDGSAPAGRRYRAEDPSGLPRARIEFDYGQPSGAVAGAPADTPAPVAQPRPVKPPSVSIASPLDVRPTAGPRPVTRRLNPIAPPPENTAQALSWLDPLDLLGLPITPGGYAGNY